VLPARFRLNLDSVKGRFLPNSYSALRRSTANPPGALGDRATSVQVGVTLLEAYRRAKQNRAYPSIDRAIQAILRRSTLTPITSFIWFGLSSCKALLSLCKWRGETAGGLRALALGLRAGCEAAWAALHRRCCGYGANQQRRRPSSVTSCRSRLVSYEPDRQRDPSCLGLQVKSDSSLRSHDPEVCLGSFLFFSLLNVNHAKVRLLKRCNWLQRSPFAVKTVGRSSPSASKIRTSCYRATSPGEPIDSGANGLEPIRRKVGAGSIGRMPAVVRDRNAASAVALTAGCKYGRPRRAPCCRFFRGLLRIVATVVMVRPHRGTASSP